MNRYGIIGYPLTHSFSKKYFIRKFQSQQIHAEFVNFEIFDIQKFPEMIRNTENLKGLSVTIPFKEKIIPFLDEIEALAEKLGAVNSIQITRKAGKVKLKGFNTDLYGFCKSLKDFIGEAKPKALILGTGGAAKAVAGGLSELGIEYKFVSRKATAQQLSYSQITKETMEHFRLIVNCSPVGTYPNQDECPNIPYQHLNSQHFLYDLVYNPPETAFLKKGASQGSKTINGIKMLHLQAEQSWKIWNAT